MGSEIEMYEQGCSSSIYKDESDCDKDEGIKSVLSTTQVPTVVISPYEDCEPGPSEPQVQPNPLAGQFPVAEIPPYRPRPHIIKEKRVKLREPVLKEITPEEREIQLAHQRRHVAFAKAYNLYTDEEIDAMPPERVPRSVCQRVPPRIEERQHVPDIEPMIEEEVEERVRNGRFRRVIHRNWQAIRNFLRRIRRAFMNNFIRQYAPHADEYLGRTEEEYRAIEDRNRKVVLEEEKMHVHMLFMQQMEYANHKPTPYREPQVDNKRVKMSQEYIDFVMFKDLQPLVELKKLKEQEAELLRDLEASRIAFQKFNEEYRLKRERKAQTLYEEDEDDDSDSDEEPAASDPLLPEPENDNQEVVTKNKV